MDRVGRTLTWGTADNAAPMTPNVGQGSLLSLVQVQRAGSRQSTEYRDGETDSTIAT